MLLLAPLLCAAVDLAPLSQARQALLAPDATKNEALSEAVGKLRTAEESCGATGSDAGFSLVFASARAGFERLLQLRTETPTSSAKLGKALKKAQAKAASFKEDMDGDDLPSRADKEALAKLEAKVGEVEAKIAFAKAVEVANKGRDLSEMAYDVSAMPARLAKLEGATLTILSNEPLVLTLDGWLPPAALVALETLAFNPANISETPTAEQLCISALGSAERKVHYPPPPELLARLDALEPEEQSRWWRNESSHKDGCGALPRALEPELVAYAQKWAIPGANETTDMLDALMARAVGFTDIDVEAIFAAVKEEMHERADPETLTAPEGWDEEEDGEWAPSMLPGKPYEEILASFMAPPNPQLDGTEPFKGLGSVFAFSALLQLTEYRASSGGAVSVAASCDDFAAERPAQRVASAVLFANDVDGGGETLFPALGLSVAPQKGRLLVYTSMTPNGHCDPTALTAEAALSGTIDKLTLSKVFYSDTAFDRGGQNKERPNQDPPRVACGGPDLASCVRHDPNDLPETGAVVQAGFGHKRRS